MLKIHALAALLLWTQLSFSNEYPALDNSFDRSQLINTNTFLMDPNNFSMQQSYTMSYWASSNGSSSSQGLYLNHLSLHLSSHLNLFVDLGYHTPFHSEFQAQDPRLNAYRDSDGNQTSSMVIPRFGLEYQPSDNVHMSLQFINGTDAYKAYGSHYGSSLFSPWNFRNARNNP